MADVLKYASGNSASTTLSSSVSDSATSAPLTSDTNFSDKSGEGMVILDEGQSGEEFAYATGKSGSSLTIPLANRGLEGGSAQAHASGATVKGIITSGMWNSVIDTLVNGFLKTTGAVDTSKLVAPTGTHPVTLYNALNAPEGFLINGKIVPSVASNNLTVAIKGMDGNDPSATNPVYVRLGDSIKTISAALSVTKNAGTNWCNAGGAGLATNEIDYFVYLGYNATDGVVVGFSRIPYGTRYDSFSSTSTAETYCAISTITNAAAGDTYQVIGRLAATLSAGAGYTWTVPTYTTANLVQRPIFTTRWLTSSAPTYVGLDNGAGAAPTTTDFRYKIEHRTVAAHIMGSGTKDGTNASWDITNPIMAPANTTDNAGVGVANAFNSTASASLVMATKFISPKFYFSNSANITDNHVISSWGSTFSWEI